MTAFSTEENTEICAKFIQILHDDFGVLFEHKEKSPYVGNFYNFFTSKRTSREIVFFINKRSGKAYIEISVLDAITIKKRFIIEKNPPEKILRQIIAAWKELFKV